MARMNYAKASRTSLWQDSVRNIWRPLPKASPKATAKQLSYIKTLLERCGRPAYAQDDLERMTARTASQLISDLKAIKQS